MTLAVAAKRKRGKQTVFRQDIADEICDRIVEGESLEEICADAHMPERSTVWKWAADTQGVRSGAPEFSQQYARAKQIAVERLADEVIAIGDASILFDGKPDNALVQQARLACDNRKWLLSKLLPRTYGDKVTTEITGDPDQPLVTRIELVAVRSTHRDTIEHEPNDGEC